MSLKDKLNKKTKEVKEKEIEKDTSEIQEPKKKGFGGFVKKNKSTNNELADLKQQLKGDANDSVKGKDNAPLAKKSVSKFGALKQTSDAIPSKTQTEPDVGTCLPTSGISSIMDLDPHFKHETQPDKFSPEMMQEIQDSIGMFYNNFDNAELVSQAIKNTWGMVQQWPFLANIIAPEDYGAMLSALRENYQVVIQKKKAKTTSRAKSDKEADELLEGMKDMEFNL